MAPGIKHLPVVPGARKGHDDIRVSPSVLGGEPQTESREIATDHVAREPSPAIKTQGPYPGHHPLYRPKFHRPFDPLHSVDHRGDPAYEITAIKPILGPADLLQRSDRADDLVPLLMQQNPRLLAAAVANAADADPLLAQQDRRPQPYVRPAVQDPSTNSAEKPAWHDAGVVPERDHGVYHADPTGNMVRGMPNEQVVVKNGAAEVDIPSNRSGVVPSSAPTDGHVVAKVGTKRAELQWQPGQKAVVKPGADAGVEILQSLSDRDHVVLVAEGVQGTATKALRVAPYGSERRLETDPHFSVVSAQSFRAYGIDAVNVQVNQSLSVEASRSGFRVNNPNLPEDVKIKFVNGVLYVAIPNADPEIESVTLLRIVPLNDDELAVRREYLNPTEAARFFRNLKEIPEQSATQNGDAIHFNELGFTFYPDGELQAQVQNAQPGDVISVDLRVQDGMSQYHIQSIQVDRPDAGRKAGQQQLTIRMGWEKFGFTEDEARYSTVSIASDAGGNPSGGQQDQNPQQQGS